MKSTSNRKRRRLKIGDLVICRAQTTGIILEIDISDLEEGGITWAKILWSDSSETWEDLIHWEEDNIFTVITASSCKDEE